MATSHSRRADGRRTDNDGQNLVAMASGRHFMETSNGDHMIADARRERG